MQCNDIHAFGMQYANRNQTMTGLEISSVMGTIATPVRMYHERGMMLIMLYV